MNDDDTIISMALALHAAGIRCSPNVVNCKATHTGHAARLLNALDRGDITIGPAADLALAAAVRRLPDYAMFGPYPDQHGKRSWRVTLGDSDDDGGGATFVAHDDEADPTAAIDEALRSE